MAIQQTVTCTNGISIENGYIKINTINYNNISKQAEISVNIFKDKSYSDNGKLFIEQRYYTFSPSLTSGMSLLNQGYEYLKTNIYTTAIDLLDEGQTA